MQAPGGMPPNVTAREAEMLQTHHFYQQLFALEHSKGRALATCFDKCMDPEDLRTGYRTQLDQRKADTEHRNEKNCLMMCHKKYQKVFSMATQSHQISPLHTKLFELQAASSAGMNLTAA